MMNWTAETMNKRAFTMAEVLITLGIIGIVAAMTLPTVINNIKNKQHEARFKKAYSVLYQAVLQMGNENPALWQTYCGNGKDDSSYSFITDFSKQFKVLNLYNQYGTGSLKYLGYKQQYFYRSQAGKLEFNTDGHNNGAFITQDGMIVFSSGCWWLDGLDFVVDTNGHSGPNKFGYDVFYFQISKNNQLLPSSINETFSSVGSQRAGCCAFDGNVSCIVKDNGTACSRFALMDRFPSDESKSYWKNLPPP